VEQTTLTTMCALINVRDEVLFIDRKRSWQGLALPGGHIDGNESISECAIREIEEETGLHIKSMLFRGMTHFFNNDTKERYIVFNFISNEFEGNFLNDCDEGTLYWIPRSKLNEYVFAEGMAERFPQFFEGDACEMFVQWKEKEKYIKIEKASLKFSEEDE